MLTQNTIDITRHLPIFVCPECGQHINELEATFLQECDHCLAKKED